MPTPSKSLTDDLIGLVTAFGAPRPGSFGLTELYQDLIAAIEMAGGFGGLNVINVTTAFDVPNDGSGDASAGVNAAILEAQSTASIVYMPTGIYTFENGALGSPAAPQPPIPYPSNQLPFFIMGDGNLRTILKATRTQTALVHTTGICPFFSNLCFDGMGFPVTTVNLTDLYVGGASISNCTAVGGNLLITLADGANHSAVLTPGTLVALANTHSGGMTTPDYVGQVVSYIPGGGVGNADAIAVQPNMTYPTVRPTPATPNGEALHYGYATNPIFAGLYNCRLRNRGVGYDILTPPTTGTSFTLQRNSSTGPSGPIVTIPLPTNAAAVQTALNGIDWSRSSPQCGWVCADLGNNIIIYGIGGSGFVATPGNVTDVKSNGFGINCTDSSQGKPKYFKDLWVENLTIENDLGDQQESLNIAVANIHVDKVIYRNTYESRASMTAGSPQILFDGLLDSPPIPADPINGIPGTPLAVMGAGPNFGTLSLVTGTVIASMPQIIMLNGAPSGASLAALMPTAPIMLGVGGGAQNTTLVEYETIGHLNTPCLVVKDPLTPMTTQPITVGPIPLTGACTAVETVPSPGNPNVMVTLVTLSAPAVTSVSQVPVGNVGGRGPINCFAYDTAHLSDVRATLGAYHNSDLGAMGVNFAGRSIMNEWDGFIVDDPFNVGPAAPSQMDSSDITCSNWNFPNTCFVKLSTFNAGQNYTFNNPRLLGGIEAGTDEVPGTVTVNGGIIGLSANGSVGCINVNSAASTGQWIMNGTQLLAGTGILFGSTIGNGTATVDVQWVNGIAGPANPFAGVVNGSFNNGTNVSMDHSIIRSVLGINPIGTINPTPPIPANGVQVTPIWYDRTFYIASGGSGQWVSWPDSSVTLPLVANTIQTIFCPATTTFALNYTVGTPSWIVRGN